MFIQTSTGGTFDFNDVDSNIIDIKDIAAGLSKICRFTGQCSRFYSVAEHCILGSRYILEKYPDRPVLALAFLLHDASEAYLGDVSAPLKKFIGNIYTDLENRVSAKIFKYFGIDYELANNNIIASVDLSMCITERDVLMDKRIRWSDAYENAQRLPVNFNFWLPHEIQWEYLLEFSNLFMKCGS